MSGRDAALRRVRRAPADVPEGEEPEDVPVARDYLLTHSPADAVETPAENLADYRRRAPDGRRGPAGAGRTAAVGAGPARS